MTRNKRLTPDIGTTFIAGRFDEERFIVTGWLKCVPYKYYGKDDGLEKWKRDNPDWQVEYILENCLRENATHVDAIGIVFCVVGINDADIFFEHQYAITWEKDRIDWYRNKAIELAEKERKEPLPHRYILGRKHD